MVSLDLVSLDLDPVSARSKIAIWDNPNKTGDPCSLPVTFQTPTGIPVNGKDLWVEGVEPSSSERDITLTLQYPVAGNTFEDKINLTVLGVVSVDPSEATKVMISTMHDDTYPSTYQTEDGKIWVEATVNRLWPGMPVYFRVLDPDDGSPYDTVDVNDNAGGLGTLSAEVAYTDDFGVAETFLTITNQHAGDNYIVEASLASDFCSAKQSGILTAWKRVYVELSRNAK